MLHNVVVIITGIMFEALCLSVGIQSRTSWSLQSKGACRQVKSQLYLVIVHCAYKHLGVLPNLTPQAVFPHPGLQVCLRHTLCPLLSTAFQGDLQGCSAGDSWKTISAKRPE